MADSAEHYNKLVEEERERLRGLSKDHAPQIPAYSRKEKEMTREEEAADYRMAKNTQGGYAMRLKEGKAKFGLNKAVTDILDWAIRNERA